MITTKSKYKKTTIRIPGFNFINLFVILGGCSKDDEPERFTLKVLVSPNGAGTVNPSSGTYNSGQQISVSATPSQGYIFNQWSGDTSGAANPLIFKITSNTEITAEFIKKDTDADGISDDIDQCPETPTGEEVDENGCSESQKDGDGDGVSNDLDECANTPSDETANEKGCSASQTDSDGDTITDDIDQCPETPAGEEVDENGCSLSQIDSDDDGVSDALDQYPDTQAGEEVDEQGCSERQKDNAAPVVINSTVLDITSTSFTVEWTLDEGSKGYIQFGTEPGVYDSTTAVEDGFLTFHRQTVGGTNPYALAPETTYYWRIYVEDQYGNSGFSGEQSTTTPEYPGKTYVPDDGFEKNLIEQGLDDVLDDYVLTKNIENVLTLTLGIDCFDYDYNMPSAYVLVKDYTGLEDFTALEEITFLGYWDSYRPELTAENIDLSHNLNLRKITLRGVSINGVDLSKNTLLEELHFRGGEPGEYCYGTINNLDLRDNVNFKILSLYTVNHIDDINLLFSRVPSLEELYFDYPVPISLVNNKNLRFLKFGSMVFLSEVVDLRNGANEKLEYINAYGLGKTVCIEADLIEHVESVIIPNTDTTVIVTDDCGN